MEAGLERRAIRIRGVVQGVGFRPAMFRLADALGIAGFVRNDRDGVFLEIEGEPQILDEFVEKLDAAAPPSSHIETVEVALIGAQHERAFRIAESPRPAAARDTAASIPTDLAPCADCLRELADPQDRRPHAGQHRHVRPEAEGHRRDDAEEEHGAGEAAAQMHRQRRRAADDRGKAGHAAPSSR